MTHCTCFHRPVHMLIWMMSWVDVSSNSDFKWCNTLLTAVNCGNLTDPANGSVNHTGGTTFGQTAIYSCDIGYNPVGDSTRTCQAEGNWSGNAPTCEGMYIVIRWPFPTHWWCTLVLSNFCFMLYVCFEDRFCVCKKSWIGRGGQVSAWGTMLMAHSTAFMCFLQFQKYLQMYIYSV